MEEVKVNKEDLDNFIEDLFCMQRKGNYVFRGYCNHNELIPSLVRNYDMLKLNEYGIMKYEILLLRQYAKYAIQYLPSYFTPLDWVASAQHFGLPTRLIDWSFDPFCALYFATSFNKEPEHNCYKLIMVDLNENMYFNEIPLFEPDVLYSNGAGVTLLDNYLYFVNGLLENNITGSLYKDYEEKGKKEFCNKLKKYRAEEFESKKRKLFFCSIYESNPRVIAQKGLFQIPCRFVNENKDDTIDKDILSAASKVYLIDKEMRNDIIKILYKLKVTTTRLFPDLQNICTYLKNAETWQLSMEK